LDKRTTTQIAKQVRNESQIRIRRDSDGIVDTFDLIAQSAGRPSAKAKISARGFNPPQPGAAEAAGIPQALDFGHRR
jgi:hypothetical protein